MYERAEIMKGEFTSAQQMASAFYPLVVVWFIGSLLPMAIDLGRILLAPGWSTAASLGPSRRVTSILRFSSFAAALAGSTFVFLTGTLCGNLPGMDLGSLSLAASAIAIGTVPLATRLAFVQTTPHCAGDCWGQSVKRVLIYFLLSLYISASWGLHAGLVASAEILWFDGDEIWKDDPVVLMRVVAILRALGWPIDLIRWLSAGVNLIVMVSTIVMATRVFSLCRAARSRLATGSKGGARAK
jgi:hypothetical protein